MRTPILSVLAGSILLGVAAGAAAVVSGAAAPGFTITDTSGKAVTLADYKGKYVVLEWTNPECPFVRKHYSSGNMQAQGAAPAATLLDSTSGTARAYAAKTTPHMFVVDPGGTIIYAGAIDDKRSANPADAKTANNYIRAALTEAMAGKPVTVASTTPYGCSVKY